METALAVTNILEIIDVSDKILVDRGDLSREISIPLVPLAVFNILKLSKTKNKPVMIATNVLDSMMTQNIPSRAEISDIFSHLSAGASGFVLAAEVAIGSNPVSSTALLKHLIELLIIIRTVYMELVELKTHLWSLLETNYIIGCNDTSNTYKDNFLK